MNRKLAALATSTALALTVVATPVAASAAPSPHPHITAVAAHRAHHVSTVKKRATTHHLTPAQRARLRAALARWRADEKYWSAPPVDDSCDPAYQACSPPVYAPYGIDDPENMICEPMGASGTYCHPKNKP